ncbi:cupin domain-containing protein [Mycoplasmopsis iners]|uniref:hypothetical protein n=1 Tax=Mycoplasmopsis iners TaxID=76630 RepID=UPI00068FFA47|nr:hypothetical protein [Mycoplasmopsis iners]
MYKKIDFAPTYNYKQFKFRCLKKNSEFFDEIFSNSSIRIEVIYSKNAETDWMRNKFLENVFLLKGKAILEDENQTQITMKSGDFLTIEKILRHKVVKTSKKCIWIAIHHKK